MSTEPAWNSWPCWALESNCRLPFVISCRFVFACRSYPIPYSSDLSFNRYQCRFPLQKERWKKKTYENTLIVFHFDLYVWCVAMKIYFKQKREREKGGEREKRKKKTEKKKFFFSSQSGRWIFRQNYGGS